MSRTATDFENGQHQTICEFRRHRCERIRTWRNDRDSVAEIAEMLNSIARRIQVFCDRKEAER
jgi:hypothetical protein